MPPPREYINLGGRAENTLISIIKKIRRLRSRKFQERKKAKKKRKKKCPKKHFTRAYIEEGTGQGVQYREGTV